MENRGDCVSDRVSTPCSDRKSIPNVAHETRCSKVVKKLLVETPSAQLVDGYLTEISKAYGVKWSSSTTQSAVEDEAGKLVGVASSVIDLLTGLL